MYLIVLRRFRLAGQRGLREAEGVSEQATVLVVDDDSTVRDVVARYLTRDGHRVVQAGSGLDGLTTFRAHHPDLVILDLMMPGLHGLEVCRRIRSVSHVPIMLLTALGEESDRIAGLEFGADDYLVKPFSPRELALRASGLLRRGRPDALAGNPPASRLGDGDIAIDLAARRATRAERALALTIREFDLLAFLVGHPGQVFTRAQLMERVWGWTFGDTSTVTVHVRRLREKIETDPAEPTRIATVWGVGYRFDPAPAARFPAPSPDPTPAPSPSPVAARSEQGESG